MRSYPQLSLRGRPTVLTIRPSARTATRPRTCSRIIPKAQTPIPPAFVATIPPTVAESRAARSTPKCSPAALACAATRAAVTPAPTTTVRSTASTGSIRSRPVVSSEQGRPIGHRPTDQAGVAALDLHGHARRPRRHQHRRDLLGRARPDRPEGRAAPAPRPVDAVPGQEVRVGRHRDPGRLQGVAQARSAGRSAASERGRSRPATRAAAGAVRARVLLRIVRTWSRGHPAQSPARSAPTDGPPRAVGVAHGAQRTHRAGPLRTGVATPVGEHQPNVARPSRATARRLQRDVRMAVMHGGTRRAVERGGALQCPSRHVRSMRRCWTRPRQADSPTRP